MDLPEDSQFIKFKRFMDKLPEKKGEVKDGTVNGLAEFIEKRNLGEEDFDKVERNTYKYTDCGAWISQTDTGIKLGSIIEGAEESTKTHQFDYPFDIGDFWKAVQAVEDEADEIWKSTHGCEDCGLDGAINPDCDSCHGKGVII